MGWCLPTLGVQAQVQVREVDRAAPVTEEAPPQPIIEAPPESETPAPLPIERPSESDTGIRQEIRDLTDALEQRRAALNQTRERQAFAESLLSRLDNEFRSLQQRLETAGLGLTESYAQQLRRRLERLQQQHLAKDLEPAIKEQLEAARVEQFQLEEFGAVLDPEDASSDFLLEQRAQLLARLREAVGSHIDLLNKYFRTIRTLKERIDAYQSLVRRRLFWLPSTQPVGRETPGELVAALSGLFSGERWARLLQGMPDSLLARFPLVLFLALCLVGLVQARRGVRQRLMATGEHIGNVDHDRIGLTVRALGYSAVMALTGVTVLVLLAVTVSGAGQVGAALARGFLDGAMLLFMLGLIRQVCRAGGLAECHFNWRPQTLQATRKAIPRLLTVLLPAAILAPLTVSPVGADYESSLGRLIFLVASLALAYFLHYLFQAYRDSTERRRLSKSLKLIQFLLVSTPLALAGLSLFGYHYTAVQLEATLFVSICWLVVLTLLRYLGLRALSVRERRLKLEWLREQRAREHEMEAILEAAGSSGEGRSAALDLPDVNLHNISSQSKASLRIVTLALAVAGLWVLWTPVIPALRVFDEIIVWSVLEGAESIDITLADLALAALIAMATLFAARNLPGTLEVALLSRMHLAPGTGYAITTVVNYLVVIVGVIAAFNLLGAQWSKLQWLVAALGVGLGFGLQEIVANFVSGIILLFERPIRVGDTITIGGITGTVSRIRIRATTLVDWDRKEQIIPNKTFVTQDLTNWTLSDSITRVIVHVRVAYGSDVDRVQSLLMGIVRDNERVVADPVPAVFCVGLGDSGIHFELRVFVRSILDIMPLSHELHAAITRELRQAGIEIPFPQRDIHIRTEPGAWRNQADSLS
ncbi:MAG: mechanosensitive ion channel [Marinobacter sp.]|uniref:mechanosensitive ion channel domain-containing protein n=1 Tax=Marinobacter sp. TaxID=50741 RepID=UPI00299D8F22|nr:mechanosensitive ion channel domain-containing protein [Marinobacter sp.]MDX1757351.1 mechanosensitive ion channel [Marinobacter sp.]